MIAWASSLLAIPPGIGAVLRTWQPCNTILGMKTLTVRLPEPLAAEIEAESNGRGISKSDVIRERVQIASRSRVRRRAPVEAIADLIGSVAGLPADLSRRRKHYLSTSGYGRKRTR